MLTRYVFLLGVILLAESPCSLAQSHVAAARWAPSTTVIWAEIGSAQDLFEHPLRKKLVASSAFRKLWKSPEALKLRGGMSLAELAIGDSIENMLRQLTAGKVYFLLDAETQGAAVWAETESKEWLSEYRSKLVAFMRDKDQKKQTPSLKEVDYRGLVALEINKNIVVAIDRHLLVTNKKELAKSIVDRYLDEKQDGLTTKESFLQAHERRPLDSSYASEFHEAAWVYVDVKSIRDAGAAKELLSGKPRDFGAELILGGLLEILHETPSITGRLMMKPSGLELSLHSLAGSSQNDSQREYYFGPSANGRALPVIKSEGAIATLSAYRNVAQLWLHAGDLFDQKVNDQLAQADNTLTTLFSGRDFGEEILGAIDPELRLVVSRQQFQNGGPVPSIKLPSFALVARLKNPETMSQELKRIFQSFVGFLNIVGAQQGQPQLDLNMQLDAAQKFYWAAYVPEIDRKVESEVPIQFNFSPCLAFVSDQVILSSTHALAKQLASTNQEWQSKIADQVSPTSNTILQVDLSAVVRTLEDNRQQLVSQNVFEKGHSRKEAEQEIGMLLAILDIFKNASLDLEFTDQPKLVLTASISE